MKNKLSSVAIAESPATPGPGQRRDLVALMSNVLKVNTAWDHAWLGAAIEEIIRTRRPTTVRDKGKDAEQSEAGRED